MASLFDYIYTCYCCKEQCVSEGRGETPSHYVFYMGWDVRQGQLKMKVENEERVCVYCCEEPSNHFISSDKAVVSPWVKEVLTQFQIECVVDEEYFVHAPFAPELTVAECLKAAKKLLKKQAQQKVVDDTKTVKELLKGLVANPDCDVSKLEKEVAQIFGKASKSTSSKATKFSSSKSKTTEIASTGSSASVLFDFYTKSKLIGWLESVGDTRHRKSWKKDALVGALVDYPLVDVLASFSLADLKAGMEELELSTKGKKKALIDRLIASL